MSKKKKRKLPEDFLSHDIDYQLHNLMHPPSEVERAEAKAKAASLEVKTDVYRGIGSILVLQAVHNSEFEVLRQAEDLGFDEQHPVYQRAVDAYAVGTEAASLNMQAKLAPLKAKWAQTQQGQSTP